MPDGEAPAMLASMDAYPSRTASPLRVVVAGGGVAGLETLVALRGLAGERVHCTLIAPEDAFTLRALTVFEPFGMGRPHRYPLGELTHDLGADHRRNAIVAIDRRRHRVELLTGEHVPYDVLVLAIGATPRPAFEHGLCFDRDPAGIDALVADARAGRARSIALVVPAGVVWPLPAYELALLLGAFEGTSDEPAPRVTLVTVEAEPLEVFGAPATAMVRTELNDAGVDLVVGATPTIARDGVIELGGGGRLHADRIVHLPVLSGPHLAGVPCDDDGFITVDGDLRIPDDRDVYAVGDGTTRPIKQGGLAAQQAEAVAELIARRAGADRPPRPYTPVLRALLRTAHGPRYMRADPPGGTGESLVSDQCLWWPPSKVASHWLTPWLATRDLETGRTPPPRRLPTGGITRGSVALPH